MEEIKVGEYVRDCDGFIVKVNEIQDYKEDDDIWFQEKTLKGTWKSMVVKHSPNIIDLIEEGDVVKYKLKGLSVSGIRIVKKHIDARTSKENLLVQGFMLEQLEIKSIVTKEQFTSIEFRLED